MCKFNVYAIMPVAYVCTGNCNLQLQLCVTVTVTEPDSISNTFVNNSTGIQPLSLRIKPLDRSICKDSKKYDIF